MQVTLANWRTAPFNRWAFHHVRELVPSADIPHDPARVRPLPRAEAALSIDSFLGETDTDGMAIVHRGRLVFERYAHGMTEETPHILMSVSKSMLGLLAYDRRLDDDRKVTEFFPELERTAYRRATLRQINASLLEMGSAFMATPAQRIFKIILPAASGLIFAGFRLGLAQGLTGAVLAELLITPTGVGDLITYSRSIADYPAMFASVFSIIVFASVAVTLLQRLETRVFRPDQRRSA